MAGNVTIGEWLFHPASRRARRGHDDRKLSPKAAAVLLALAETPGQVWSRDALLERIWSGVIVGEEVLTHAIAEIRKALSDDFRTPRYLETVHKGGYRLLCTATHPGTEASERTDTFDLAAYASYLTACELYERGGRVNTCSAIAQYASLLQANPAFELAHVGMAKALTFLDCVVDIDLDLALDHCAIAHKLKSGLAEAYAAEGFLLAIARNRARSAACFRTALDLRPESAETLYLVARACMATGSPVPAASMLERAASLRADDYHSLVLAGKIHQMLADERQARSNYKRALPRLEAHLDAHPDDFRALSGKARSLWYLGKTDEAMAVLDVIAAHPDPMQYSLACTLAQVGHARQALDVLEDVVERGWRYRAWLERDPDFAALRGDRRYKRIAASIAAA